jgi:thiol-disulfide isomerase/thioredoxin
MNIGTKIFIGALTLLFAHRVYAAGKTPSKDSGYTVKIKIAGCKDSMLLMATYYADKQYLKDSAYLDKQGFYVFKGTKKIEQGMYTIAGQAKVKFFDFFMDEQQNFTLETDTTDFDKYMKVTGSEENALFFEYQRYMTAKYHEVIPIQTNYRNAKSTNKDSAEYYLKQINLIDSVVKNHRKQFIASHPKNFFPKLLTALQEVEVPAAPKNADGSIDSNYQYRFYKAHFWDNVDLTDDRLLHTPFFYEKLKKFFDQVVMQNPDSVYAEAVRMIDRTKEGSEMFKYLVIHVTNRSETSEIMGMDAAFVYMVKKYYKTGKAFWVDTVNLYRIVDAAEKLEPILIGRMAPPLNCADSSLAALIPLYSVKAKYTVVVFWDPGCGHCQKEMPKLVESYDKMLKDGLDVKIYSVCSASNVEEWKKYIVEKKHQKFINVIDHDISRRKYNISSTPVFFILDENKKIIAKRLVSEQIEDFLKRYSAMKKGQTLTVQLRTEEDEH